MGKSKSRRQQKLYKMRGCSKKTRKHRRKHLGGSADINLAYTGQKVASQSNPFLAYTGKGGSGVSLANAYPSEGPAVPQNGLGWINSQGNMHGGTCTSCGLMKGGGFGVIKGGSCGCGLMKGGSAQTNGGLAYPDGLVGTPWKPEIGGWPGVNNATGSANYYPVNNYNQDISRQMQAIGANPPFNGGKRSCKGKSKGKGKSKKQRGGVLSNFIGQDLVNLGRQTTFGLGSAYNAISGYPSPANPLPWKGQLPTTANIHTIKAAYN